MTRHRLNTRRRSGTTITELIIAISIMGILAAVTVPKWTKALESQRARSAAQAVESDLRMAMRLAAIRSAPIQFTVRTGTAIVEYTPPISRYASGTTETIDYSLIYPGVKFSRADFNQSTSGRVDIYQQLTSTDAASNLSTALIQVNSGSTNVDVNLLDSTTQTNTSTASSTASITVTGA